MFLGPVRETVVKIILQILGYELRLCFTLVTKLSGWEDEAGMLAAYCGSCPFPLRKRCPSVQHRSNSTRGLLSRWPQ